MHALGTAHVIPLNYRACGWTAASTYACNYPNFQGWHVSEDMAYKYLSLAFTTDNDLLSSSLL